MNVDSVLKATLQTFGYPVSRLMYKGRAETFFTYQLVVGKDSNFTDDESSATEYIYRVDLYSKKDYIDLLKRLKTELKAAGFYGVTFDPEVYEQDTGYFHIPVEIKYMEV